MEEQPLELVTVRVTVFAPDDDQFTEYGPTPEPDAMLPPLKLQVYVDVAAYVPEYVTVALAPTETEDVAVNADVGAALTTAVTFMVDVQPDEPVTIQV